MPLVWFRNPLKEPSICVCEQLQVMRELLHLHTVESYGRSSCLSIISLDRSWLSIRPGKHHYNFVAGRWNLFRPVPVFSAGRVAASECSGHCHSFVFSPASRTPSPTRQTSTIFDWIPGFDGECPLRTGWLLYLANLKRQTLPVKKSSKICKFPLKPDAEVETLETTWKPMSLRRNDHLQW